MVNYGTLLTIQFHLLLLSLGPVQSAKVLVPSKHCQQVF